MKVDIFIEIFAKVCLILIITLGCNAQDPTNPEMATDLPTQMESLELGEAYIWFLGHCGFAVQTKNTLLIFDYVENVPNSISSKPEHPSLWAAHIEPDDINEYKPDVVFPMHVRIGDEEEYFDSFKNTFQNLIENNQIILTYNNRGAAYHYKNGLVSPMLNIDK